MSRGDHRRPEDGLPVEERLVNGCQFRNSTTLLPPPFPFGQPFLLQNNGLRNVLSVMLPHTLTVAIGLQDKNRSRAECVSVIKEIWSHLFHWRFVPVVWFYLSPMFFCRIRHLIKVQLGVNGFVHLEMQWYAHMDWPEICVIAAVSHLAIKRLEGASHHEKTTFVHTYPSVNSLGLMHMQLWSCYRL